MAVIGDAYIEVHGEYDGFQKESESRIGGIAKKAAAIFAGAFAVDQAIQGIRASIDAASDLNETISKSRTIFGPAAADLEKWASGAAKGMGQSKQQALDAAATFGNLFTQLGIGTGKAADMSKQMVGLASDFASFHNANPAEVIEAQTAAFRGEYDALQRFVPTINAAAVQQKAMAMTGKENADALTDQEKALATQQLMMEGAGAAMGDFARTSDGLANKQRIFSAQMEDLKAKIGGALMPIMSKLVGLLSNQLLPAFERVSEFARKIGEAFRAGMSMDTSSFDGFLGVVARAGDLFAGTLLPAIRQVSEFLRDHWQPVLIAVGAVVLGLASPIALVVAGLVALYARFEVVRDVVGAVADFLTGTVAPAIAAFAGYVADAFGDLVTWTQEHWAQISEAIDHVVRVIRTIIETTLGVLAALWRAWGDDLMNIVGTIFNYVRETIENAVRVVQGIIQTVLAIINGDWGKAWEGIRQVVGAVWDQIGNIISTAVGIVKSLLAGALSTLLEMFRSVWTSIAETVKGAIGAVVGFVTALPGQIASAAAGAFDAIKNGAQDALNAAGNFIASIPGRLREAIGSVASAAKDVGSAILRGIVDGVSGAVGFLGDIAAALGRAVKNVVNGIIDRINDALEFKINMPSPIPDVSINPPDIPHLARGGTAYAGRVHVVGENGPELFVPGVTGTVLPNRAYQAASAGGLGGGPDLTLVYASIDTPALLERMNIAAALGDVLAGRTRLRPLTP